MENEKKPNLSVTREINDDQFYKLCVYICLIRKIE